MGTVQRVMTALALGGAIAAGPAPAQEGRFAAAGVAQLSFSAAQRGGVLSLSGDADARLRLGAGFGLSLGLYGAATDLTRSPDTPHETYGTLDWQGGGVTLSAGVPRPAWDSFAGSALDLLDPLRALEPDRLASTRSRVTSGAIHNGGLPLGLRAAGETGGLSWALSAHRMDGDGLVSAGIGWSGAAPLRLEAALEQGETGRTGAKALILGEAGGFDLGLGAYHPAGAGGEDMIEARLGLEPRPGLTLGLALQGPRHGAGTAVFGAGLASGPGELRGALRIEPGHSAASLGYRLRFGH